MENVFIVDWYALVTNFLPIAQRKPLIIAWLKSLVQPILVLYAEFLSFRQTSLYKLKHTGQVVFLQAALNDTFDPSLRRIRIQNAVIKEPVWFYDPDDDKPVWFYDDIPVYFKEESEFAGDGVDFTVLIPDDLQPSNEALEQALLVRADGIINYYKLFSKNYIITWIN